jgi:hypothetical protein
VLIDVFGVFEFLPCLRTDVSFPAEVDIGGGSGAPIEFQDGTGAEKKTIHRMPGGVIMIDVQIDVFVALEFLKSFIPHADVIGEAGITLTQWQPEFIRHFPIEGEGVVGFERSVNLPEGGRERLVELRVPALGRSVRERWLEQ